MREKIITNEASLVESISTRNRVLKASIPEESPPIESADAEEPEQVQTTEEPTAEPEKKTPPPRKETSKRKRGQMESYDEVFLKRKELKARQSVYISQETHASVARLVHLLALSGKEISVGGYIDNVVAEHLESYKDFIADLSRRELDKFHNT